MKKFAAAFIALMAIAGVAAPTFAATTQQHRCVYLDKSMCHSSDRDESISSTKNN